MDKKLHESLLKFQAKNIKIKPDSKNPHFKSEYVSLDAILEAIRIPLAECGLSFVQLVESREGCPCRVRTILAGETGQLESVYENPYVKPDAQGIQAGITYARRAALSAILGLATDWDDDGNSAVPVPPKTIDKANHVDENIKKFVTKFPELAAELKALPEGKKLTQADKEFIFGGGGSDEEICNLVTGLLSARKEK